VNEAPAGLGEAHLRLDFEVVPDVGVEEAHVERVDAVLDALDRFFARSCRSGTSAFAAVGWIVLHAGNFLF
jgi:protein tyrosine phosphatase (PTP) superfamily phosphohydrolase (DUF442 family)